MVPLKLLLAGGAGLTFEQRCAKILAEEFDPPIKTGTHSEVRKKLEGKGSTRQAEHIVTNASLQNARGGADNNIGSLAGSEYSSGKGPTYDVFDGQKVGAEHKAVTDAAREFEEAYAAKSGGLPPTLGERIDAAEKWTEKQLQEKLKRGRGPKRDRFNPKKKRTEKEKKKIAKFAAKCIAEQTRKQFKKLGVPLKTRTKFALLSKKRVKQIVSASRRAERGI
jgi:hypothetical protein